jgi:hypothetical protein
MLRLSLNAMNDQRKERKEAQVAGEGSFFLRLSFKIFRGACGGGASGSGLRPVDSGGAGAESGRGLRAGLTTMLPGGVALIVEVDGVGAVIDGDGEGLGAGELCIEEDDFSDGVAGCGGDRNILCTASALSPGIVNLTTLAFFLGGWPSELVVLCLRSWGLLVVCFGGPIDVLALLDTLMVEEKIGVSTGSAFTTGCGKAGGRACGWSCLDLRDLIVLVRTFSVCLNASLPYIDSQHQKFDKMCNVVYLSGFLHLPITWIYQLEQQRILRIIEHQTDIK